MPKPFWRRPALRPLRATSRGQPVRHEGAPAPIVEFRNTALPARFSFSEKPGDAPNIEKQNAILNLPTGGRELEGLIQ